MPNVDTPQPGHFCWIELATSDADRAKEFYTSLFEWTTVEHDMGEMGKYYLFQKNGRDAAAMVQDDERTVGQRNAAELDDLYRSRQRR
jgi:predicted enzyme related to lactoylglutathione lyase